MRDERLRRYFKALGDKTRFDIVEELGQAGETSVSQLGLRLGVTQPLMSWHIRVLRAAGILETRRAGRQVFCSLNVAGIEALQGRFSALVAGEPSHDAPSALVTPAAKRAGA